MNIAGAVEICGHIKPESFQQAFHQLVTDAEGLGVNVVEQDGKPRQILQPIYKGDSPYIDMSREVDPRAAIEAWMMDELTRPIDLANDPLWVSALFKAADDGYFLYHRAHHIALDGYGGGMVARRLAELYTAYAGCRHYYCRRSCGDSISHCAVLRRSAILGGLPQPSRRCAACVGAQEPNRRWLSSAPAAPQQPAMIQKAAALGRAVRAEDGIGEALRCLRAWDLLPPIAPDAAIAPLVRTTRE